MAGSPERRPDLVVVVLDCVRAGSFPETGGRPGTFPALESRRDECTVFTRASAVAPWTLPSHASLFTGRYPWEHGILGEGRLQYETSLPTTAGALREAGYATLGLSANGLLYPLFAAPGSYESFRCAEWWEKTFRWIPPESLDRSISARPRNGRNMLRIFASGTPPKSSRRGYAELLRHEESSASLDDAVRAARPEEVALSRSSETIGWAGIDVANRLARVLRQPADPRPLPIASWIEPALSSWLDGQPRERPVHCFVNLLDAHEKYLSDSEHVRGLAAWWRFVRIPQNPRLWLEGDWVPTPEELALLRRHYESTLERLSRRVESIVRVLQQHDRWENTLLVVTSDHGQAFGEHQDLFHERSPYEPVLHVPLWVRWPGGRAPVAVRTDPVGLVDLAPTLLRAAGIPEAFRTSGTSLQEIPAGPRSDPVLAMADSYPTVENFRRMGRESVPERLTRAFGVAYDSDVKAIVGVRDGSVRAFRRGEDERESLADLTLPEVARATAAAREVVEEIRRAMEGPVDSSVEDRLKSWGYL